MSLFPKQPDLVGLEVGKGTIKVAALKQLRKGWHVTNLKEIPLSSAIDSIRKGSVITTALSARSVLVRPFHMLLKREKDIRSALEFQVEALLPFPMEQGVVEAQVIEKLATGSSLTVCAVKKDHLKNHLESLSQVEPEVVTNIYSALAALSSLFPESAHRLLLVHIGDKEVACAVVKNGKLLKANAFDRSKEFPVEIKKTVLSLSAKAFESIFILGSEDPYYVEEIKKATGETPHYPVIPSLQLPQERLVKFGVAIGIALCGGSASSINFRKGEFTYPYPLRRLKRPLAVFFSFSLVLAISLFALTKISLLRDERRISHAYQSLLASQGNLEANVPKSPAEYSIELQKIEKEVHSHHDTFPLYPGIPKVREVLDFLSSEAHGITIHSIHYLLVKRPCFITQKEKYRVRVDFEFTATTNSDARRLHETLVEPNPFVDTRSEVSWESSKGRYRALFYLKDKTRYHG